MPKKASRPLTSDQSLDKVKSRQSTPQTESCVEKSEVSASTSRKRRNYVQMFQRDGFLLVPDVLSPIQCRELRDIIDNLDASGHHRGRQNTQRHIMHKCLFEQYPEQCFNIFKNDTILPIVKDLISMAGSSRRDDRSLIAHVIHNNAFKVSPGGDGQAARWHTDDPPLFIGDLPPDVHIAPMVLTCMYYLNDVRGAVDGMTHVIPGSHRLGRPCTAEEAEQMPFVCPSVRAGSVLIISSAVWHRGSSVAPDGNPRYLFQVHSPIAVLLYCAIIYYVVLFAEFVF
jgi:hypothetical protein